MLSAIRLTNLCLPYLEVSGRGRIVNIESSSVRSPIDNLALSNALRPGVVGWMKTLAREVGAKGITVNTIAPGMIDTERLRAVPGVRDASQIPLGRVGEPSEIAAVACSWPPTPRATSPVRSYRSTAGSRATCSEGMRLRLPSPLTLFGAGLVLLVATAAVLWIVPSDYYLFLPDNAKPVAPLVSVQGGKDTLRGRRRVLRRRDRPPGQALRAAVPLRPRGRDAGQGRPGQPSGDKRPAGAPGEPA